MASRKKPAAKAKVESPRAAEQAASPPVRKKPGRKKGQKRIKVHQSKRDLRNAEMQRDVAALRRKGYSFDRIAAELKCAPSTAYEHWKALLARTRKEAEQTAEDMRELELARLDDWTADLNDILRDPLGLEATGLVGEDADPEERARVAAALDPGKATDLKLKAYERLIKISQRRSELVGLDAPKKSEITGKDGEPLSPDASLTPERAAALIRAKFGEHGALRDAAHGGGAAPAPAVQGGPASAGVPDSGAVAQPVLAVPAAVDP